MSGGHHASAGSAPPGALGLDLGAAPALVRLSGRWAIPQSPEALCLRGPTPRGGYEAVAWCLVVGASSGSEWRHLATPDLVRARDAVRAKHPRASSRCLAARLREAAPLTQPAAAWLPTLARLRVRAETVRWRAWGVPGYAGYVPAELTAEEAAVWRLPPGTPEEVLELVRRLDDAAAILAAGGRP